MKSKKPNLSPNFLKSLVNYMAVGGAVVGSINQAQATIQYSALSGTPVSNATVTIPTPGGGNLSIIHRSGIIASAKGVGGALIAGSGGWQANNLAAGVNVSTAAGAFGAASRYLGYGTMGQFPNTTGRFLAIQFNDGGAKYGWVRVDVAANSASFTLIDWAYQDDGSAIDTGDTPPFPIELYAFDAKLKKGNAALTWTSTGEENFDGFSIERAEGGLLFSEIAWVDGQGRPNEKQDYQFIDKTAIDNKSYYYRLKMVDLDGSFEYSPIVELSTNELGFTISEPYPNPVVNQSFTLDIQTKEAETVKIRLFSTNGQIVHEETQSLNAGINRVKLKLSDSGAGTYFVKVQGRYYSNYQTIIVQ